jgi:hypothetical protein
VAGVAATATGPQEITKTATGLQEITKTATGLQEITKTATGLLGRAPQETPKTKLPGNPTFIIQENSRSQT